MALRMKGSTLFILCRPLASLILVLPLNRHSCWSCHLSEALSRILVQLWTLDWQHKMTRDLLEIVQVSIQIYSIRKWGHSTSIWDPYMRATGLEMGKMGTDHADSFSSFEWMAFLGLLLITPSSDPPTTDWKLRDPPPPPVLGFKKIAASSASVEPSTPNCLKGEYRCTQNYEKSKSLV